MNNNYVKYGLISFLLILIQVLILNNVLFLGYLNPIIYIYIIFIYPIKENKISLLLFSFFIGLFVDFFSNSGGSNTAALLFVAYFRLPFLRLIQNNVEFDYLLFNIKKLNFIQIIIYVFTLTFFHHLILFYLEYYKLNDIIDIIIKSLNTSLFSSVLVYLSISLFVKNNNS